MTRQERMKVCSHGMLRMKMAHGKHINLLFTALLLAKKQKLITIIACFPHYVDCIFFLFFGR